MGVDVSDVAALLLRQLTDDESVWATRLIQLAQGQVSGMLPGFAFDPGTETVAVRARGNELWLPHFPVTAVTSITVGGGGVVAATSYEWDELGHVDFGVFAILNDFEIELSDWPADSVYTVEYEYGTDPPPVEASTVVAGVVAGVLRRRSSGSEGVSQETLGSYSVSYAHPDGGGAALPVSDADMRPMRKWRRNRQASVVLVAGA